MILISNPHADSGTSWVFFAGGANVSCMRRTVAERLAEVEPVVIVERPVSLLRDRDLPSLESRCARLGNTGRSWCFRPLHLPEGVPLAGRVFKASNRRRLARELCRLLPPGDIKVVCYDSPTNADWAGRLGEDVSIYLAIDDRTVNLWGEPIEGELEAERRLLQKVQKVICVSGPLAQVLKERMPPGEQSPPIEILPNGYEERLFDLEKVGTEPELLAGIPKPRILVTGHVSERIDWTGIRGALRHRPEWTWVFVGPADPGMPEKIAELAGKACGGGELRAAPGVIWHDRIPIEAIPSLIAHCDVSAVPYRLNSFSRASCPLKAIEYLAMGAPVISTRVPSLRRYESVIRWIDEGDGGSYARALDSVLSGKSREEGLADRRASVRGDSWTRRTKQFRRLALDSIQGGAS